MELPTLTQWNAGMEHDEEAFNEVTYALNFLLNPPECHVKQDTTQSIPNGLATATPVTFTDAYKDNDEMRDPATPTYITIQTPGWYEIEWGVGWATKADTTLRSQALYLNGAYGIGSALGYNEYVNNSGTTPLIYQSYDLFLNVDDQLALGLLQGSGSSLSTSSNSGQRTFLRVRWASL